MVLFTDICFLGMYLAISDTWRLNLQEIRFLDRNMLLMHMRYSEIKFYITDWDFFMSDRRVSETGSTLLNQKIRCLHFFWHGERQKTCTWEISTINVNSSIWLFRLFSHFIRVKSSQTVLKSMFQFLNRI